MKTFTLKVDASFGVKVKAGEKVKKTQQIGADKNGLAILSPISGIVKNVSFDTQEHSFIIVLEAQE